MLTLAIEISQPMGNANVKTKLTYRDKEEQRNEAKKHYNGHTFYVSMHDVSH